ncbi:hypothetical protein BGZ61DRAFT_532454 [Ilyonectria robusta]|uniref:uncharacterized protein n=1 Tax=Ilyonectria robusta TaxID=1079257 RepID=UPI001E8EDF48|nr:uncharacterized protein BGZ61DRAFT_532454 [Ilyonectria robusta]KAH8694360.1 hypothetical protein BGZ61DRAFT_532454 [Ilyonectria robusta]
MARTYQIFVINESNAPQQYALLNQVPSVTPTVTTGVWSNVLSVISLEREDTVLFTLDDEAYGFVGSSTKTPGTDGATVNTSDFEKVILGGLSTTGEEQKGTTLTTGIFQSLFKFTGEDAPLGGEGAFCVDTPFNFTVQNALEDNWVFGLGKSIGGQPVAAATMTPAPSTSCQITPSNIWYITYGQYVQGQILNIDEARTPVVAIDFSQLPAEVTVVHSQNGTLSIRW